MMLYPATEVKRYPLHGIFDNASQKWNIAPLRTDTWRWYQDGPMDFNQNECFGVENIALRFTGFADLEDDVFREINSSYFLVHTGYFDARATLMNAKIYGDLLLDKNGLYPPFNITNAPSWCHNTGIVDWTNWLASDNGASDPVTGLLTEPKDIVSPDLTALINVMLAPTPDDMPSPTITPYPSPVPSASEVPGPTGSPTPVGYASPYPYPTRTPYGYTGDRTLVFYLISEPETCPAPTPGNPEDPDVWIDWVGKYDRDIYSYAEDPYPGDPDLSFAPVLVVEYLITPTPSIIPTPVANITPTPSSTPTVSPTATSTPIPTITPVTTITPIPTITPVGYKTPIPTITPVGYKTPIPTITPVCEKTWSLVPRFNGISICCGKDTLLLADNLIDDIGISAVAVAYWNQAGRGWVEHPKNAPFNNFNLTFGYPYFPTVDSSVDYITDGDSFSWPTYSLVTGFNSIALPRGSSISTAEELAQSIGSACWGVSKWDTSLRGWVEHPKDAPFENFSVYPAYPYFASVSENVAWP